ncbi:unnamed protein product [Linum trigynum]|uniref:phosphoribosylanthranilate isomerase n=1 Tax=Linum trigynum TaxID=586398 RepID=A0AAV2ENW0_9ROSI
MDINSATYVQPGFVKLERQHAPGMFRLFKNIDHEIKSLGKLNIVHSFLLKPATQDTLHWVPRPHFDALRTPADASSPPPFDEDSDDTLADAQPPVVTPADESPSNASSPVTPSPAGLSSAGSSSSSDSSSPASTPDSPSSPSPPPAAPVLQRGDRVRVGRLNWLKIQSWSRNRVTCLTTLSVKASSASKEHDKRSPVVKMCGLTSARDAAIAAEAGANYIGMILKHGWLLAGGINPENVSEALRTLQPDGIDVSSGICGSYGITKDQSRISSFMSAIR